MTQFLNILDEVSNIRMLIYSWEYIWEIAKVKRSELFYDWNLEQLDSETEDCFINLLFITNVENH